MTVQFSGTTSITTMAQFDAGFGVGHPHHKCRPATY